MTDSDTGDGKGHWEHFAHDADVGIRGVGDTLEQAFSEAALALTAAAVDPDALRPVEAVDIHLHGTDPEDLLYQWLNALVFESTTRHLLFCRFDLTVADGELRARAWGEPVSVARHQPAVEVKGATYTALAVRRQDGRWVAQCVIDV